ncbi:MAG: hypothetical protein NTW04_03120 [Elusimicrobia bacterium]|nr:hypothetical protein [Elusimicrobiota bacterium]
MGKVICVIAVIFMWTGLAVAQDGEKPAAKSLRVSPRQIVQAVPQRIDESDSDDEPEQAVEKAAAKTDEPEEESVPQAKLPIPSKPAKDVELASGRGVLKDGIPYSYGTFKFGFEHKLFDDGTVEARKILMFLGFEDSLGAIRIVSAEVPPGGGKPTMKLLMEIPRTGE